MSATRQPVTTLPRVMTVAEVSALLDTPARLVERWCVAGLLPGAARRAGAWAIPARALSFFCGRRVEPHYSPETAAALLDKSVETVRRWIKARRLAVVKTGTSKSASVLISESELVRWLRPAVEQLGQASLSPSTRPPARMGLTGRKMSALSAVGAAVAGLVLFGWAADRVSAGLPSDDISLSHVTTHVSTSSPVVLIGGEGVSARWPGGMRYSISASENYLHWRGILRPA